MTDNLMVYMVTQEGMGSPEAGVICILHQYYITYKKYRQSIALFSQPFCLVKQREVMVREKKKTAAWETNSLLAQLVIVSSRKVPPRKKAKEALRNKTKNCSSGLTCRHNNTKS